MIAINDKFQDEFNKALLDRRKELIKTARCKKCGDTGWKLQTDKFGNYKTSSAGALLEMPCDCLIEKQNEKTLKRSGLYERIKENTFAQYKPKNAKQQEAKKKVVQYTNDFKDNWLILSGVTGSGKTHLAIAAWNIVQKANLKNGIVKGLRADMVEYNNLVSKIVLGKRFDEDESSFEVIERYKHVSILLLDDLFRDNVNEETKAWMFQILNHRYDQKLPTIITTNKNILELEKISAPIQGRIFEKTEHGIYWTHFDEDKTINHRLFPSGQIGIENK